MQALEAIRKSIATAEDLQSVVKTMKGVAAANIRQFERAVESLADYARTVELGLQVLLASRPQHARAPSQDEPAALGAVVFGSDQGLCGRFNVQIAGHAAAGIREMAGPGAARRILAVGTRIIPLLATDDLAVDEQVAPATSLAQIGPLVRDVLMRIEAWRAGGTVDRVVLFFNESLGGALYRPRTQRLLPVDAEWFDDLSGREWPSRCLPIFTVEWDGLFSSLIREHFWVSLFRASAESLAGENASRLASMQAAERNIEERLAELAMHYRLSRQHSITEELLDIISGFEALAADAR